MSDKEPEYICVEVARREMTHIYILVPRGWRPRHNGSDCLLLARAARATTREDDWGKNGWERNLEIISHKPVTDKEAEHYSVFDATTELASRK